MHEGQEAGSVFTGYEYMEIPLKGKNTAFCLDCYQNFGWVLDERTNEEALRGKGKLLLKRNRKIVNKTELTRLQHHFEACQIELKELEQSKTTGATLCAIVVGMTGSAFLALATFASVHVPPLVVRAIVLAIPGFAGWILPWFLYRWMVRRRTKVADELIERKYDEIYEICEKGNALLQ